MKIREALQALVPSVEACESIAEARRASIRRAVGQPPIAHCVSCDIGALDSQPAQVLKLGDEGVEACL